MSRLDKVLEKIRDSDAYNQIRAKYDEMDAQTKLYVNLGAVAAIILFVFLTVLIGMARLHSLKSEIDEKEELIGYLQRSADAIRQLKSQQASAREASDLSASLPDFIENQVLSAKVDRSKIDVGSERPGVDDKESHETLVDVKMTGVNLKQIVRLLFNLTEQGRLRSVNIKDLLIDTKADPSGYMDAAFTVASYKTK